MKKNSLILISIMIISFVCVSINSAWAGNVQRNRWEGVAIGIGAAILGKVVWDHIHYGQAERIVTHHIPRPQVNSYYRSKPGGHWEIQKLWVPPVYKKFWNPGHYNRRGRWVSGRWINIEISPGCWKEERVWIAENY